VPAWTKDLKGYSGDAAVVQVRWSAALLLRAVYQQAVSVEVGRVWFRDDTPFDVLRDKGVFLFTAGARF
jgi:hypothetical protein